MTAYLPYIYGRLLHSLVLVATWGKKNIQVWPMENITVARRSGKDWYVGAITNWDARSVQVRLDFLGEGKYTAEIYADAPDAGTEATHTTFTKQPVDRSTVLDVKMAPGGGNAIWIHPAS